MVSTFLNPASVDLSRVRLSIRSLQPQLVGWRRQLHQKPELGFKEIGLTQLSQAIAFPKGERLSKIEAFLADQEQGGRQTAFTHCPMALGIV